MPVEMTSAGSTLDGAFDGAHGSAARRERAGPPRGGAPQACRGPGPPRRDAAHARRHQPADRGDPAAGSGAAEDGRGGEPAAGRGRGADRPGQQRARRAGVALRLVRRGSAAGRRQGRRDRADRRGRLGPRIPRAARGDERRLPQRHLVPAWRRAGRVRARQRDPVRHGGAAHRRGGSARNAHRPLQRARSVHRCRRRAARDPRRSGGDRGHERPPLRRAAAAGRDAGDRVRHLERDRRAPGPERRHPAHRGRGDSPPQRGCRAHQPRRHDLRPARLGGGGRTRRRAARRRRGPGRGRDQRARLRRGAGDPHRRLPGRHLVRAHR